VKLLKGKCLEPVRVPRRISRPRPLRRAGRAPPLKTGGCRLRGVRGLGAVHFSVWGRVSISFYVRRRKAAGRWALRGCLQPAAATSGARLRCAALISGSPVFCRGPVEESEISLYRADLRRGGRHSAGCHSQPGAPDA
jgi:hypothetical protein